MIAMHTSALSTRTRFRPPSGASETTLLIQAPLINRSSGWPYPMACRSPVLFRSCDRVGYERLLADLGPADPVAVPRAFVPGSARAVHVPELPQPPPAGAAPVGLVEVRDPAALPAPHVLGVDAPGEPGVAALVPGGGGGGRHGQAHERSRGEGEETGASDHGGPVPRLVRTGTAPRSRG